MMASVPSLLCHRWQCAGAGSHKECCWQGKQNMVFPLHTMRTSVLLLCGCL